MLHSTKHAAASIRPASRIANSLLAAGAIILCPLLLIVLWDFIAAEWHARDAEREAIAFANSIPINATRQSVESIFARGDYTYLTRRSHSGTEEWFFHTPSRVGANDWIVIVGFDGDRVVSVRVGTSDDLRRRPDGAPLERTLRTGPR